MRRHDRHIASAVEQIRHIRSLLGLCDAVTCAERTRFGQLLLIAAALLPLRIGNVKERKALFLFKTRPDAVNEESRDQRYDMPIVSDPSTEIRNIAAAVCSHFLA